MRNLKEKLQKQSGFTLIEMLIVVAIIAILIAVSIPMVNGALEKARQATDAANERAAKGEITVCYIADVTSGDVSEVKKNTVYYYDAVTGALKENTTDILGYGKCSAHKGNILAIGIDNDTEEIKMAWVKSSSTTSMDDLKPAGDPALCGTTVNSSGDTSTP